MFLNEDVNLKWNQFEYHSVMCLRIENVNGHHKQNVWVFLGVGGVCVGFLDSKLKKKRKIYV